MLRILNQINHQVTWSTERHLDFVKKCEKYIHGLQQNNHLIAAQPLTKSGVILSHSEGTWKEESLNKTGEAQVGYYHIRAHDLSEAIKLAKENPEFEFSKTARIEIRPITEEEKETGFVYPH